MMRTASDWITSNRIGRTLQIAGGAMLLVGALRGRRRASRTALALLGGGLVFAGATGRGRLGRRGTVHLVRTVLINRPAEELYAFWRHFENLPRILRHLESVQTLDRQRSHWRARGPLGTSVEWDSELTHDIPNRELGWRSVPGADVENAGIVRFEPAPLGHGTQLQVEMRYAPPAGRLGAMVARLFGEEPHRQVDDDLQRFKRMMESAADRAETRTMM